MRRDADPNRADDAEILRARGVIPWMTKNQIAANLLMALLLIGGAIMATNIKQEVFPEFTLNYIAITVAYPGASPAEAEEIVTSVEQAVAGIEGVEEITASASEGVASVVVQLFDDVDPNRALSDVKNAVDRITTMPVDAEQPQVSLIPNKREVISLVFYGDVGEKNLRVLAERARNALKAMPKVTEVELSATRPQEIHLDVPQETLRKYGMTLSDVAAAVRMQATELPAGGIKTDSGEVLLRTREKPTVGAEFSDLTVRATPSGAAVTVGDLGAVRDGFAETDSSATFNGKPAIMLKVYRSADQTPVEVADAVKTYVLQLQADLPAGVGVATWMDQSEWYRDRLDLMTRNMVVGFLLVLIILGLFLETRLAFWVTLGIPISFLGSLLFLPTLDVSINMISMFAFIVTLGIVVDDAIVVGENIYEKRRSGHGYLAAAVAGAREVAKPVAFSVLTSIAAFTPMLMVPGISGKLFGVIPAIVITVLVMSLIESFFILPAHLSHGPSKRPLWRTMLYWALPLSVIGLIVGAASPLGALPGLGGGLALAVALPLAFIVLDTVFSTLRVFADRALYFFVHRMYRPVLQVVMAHRYLTLAASLAITLVACGQVAGGRMKFTFMPNVESDIVFVQVNLPFGAPVAETEAVRERLVDAARTVLDRNGGEERYSRGIFAQVGAGMPSTGPVAIGGGGAGGHVATVQVYLVGSDARAFTAPEFVRDWRAEVGEITGVETIQFKDSLGGPSAGMPIDVRLSHTDIDVLERAAADLADTLGTYAGVKDIDPGFKRGKPQVEFTVTPYGEAAGLSEAEVGRQVRSAFFGAEAKRQQRGLDEMKVMVRLPPSERRSEHDLEELVLRTPQGEVPLRLVVDTTRGYAYTSIRRTDEQRTLNITADIDSSVTNANDVFAALLGGPQAPLIALTKKYSGLSFGFSGERKEQMRTMEALLFGFGFALLLIYALIAIPFRSYLQPVVIMFAIIPSVGAAIFGHLLMGYDLSMISTMGMIALAGVVINDSLVMVDTANRYRLEENMSAWEAIRNAGLRRFRPIMLTSLTTFGGLAPMIMETSVQARFLIPMAISLGFGILITLPFIHITVPAVYLIVEDIKRVFGLGPGVMERPGGDPPDGDGGDAEGLDLDATDPEIRLPGTFSPA